MSTVRGRHKNGTRPAFAWVSVSCDCASCRVSHCSRFFRESVGPVSLAPFQKGTGRVAAEIASQPVTVERSRAEALITTDREVRNEYALLKVFALMTNKENMPL